MNKKHIFVSFDYDNDRTYKLTLQMWDKNTNIDFFFSDKSSNEINSDVISVVRGNLTKKIQNATAILVLVGNYYHEQHKDHKDIGYKNWQTFEVEKAKELGKKVIAVMLTKKINIPLELKDASLASSFDLASVSGAVNEAY